MTKHHPIHQRRAPHRRCDRLPANTIESTAEEAAVLAGVTAGDEALARLGWSGVLLLFANRRRSVDAAPRLEALRTYAELRRVLLRQGHYIPASSLAVAGYTPAEIARFDAIIAAVPSSNVTRFGKQNHSLRTENV